jgi:UDP-glucuronate 4-epimerase
LKILVTGAAGFIGFSFVNELIKLNFDIVGLDNLNDYYDPKLKIDRLKNSGIEIKLLNSKTGYITSKLNSNYKFIKTDIEDYDLLKKIFEENKFDLVCHLAAQAGVRYSLENPRAYINCNVIGFFNILELCKLNNIQKLIYASSSSIYGNNDKVPFSVSDKTDSPVSLYAATKKSNELMAYTYSHLYNIETIGLRFFTVYGPWGRPDMAYFSFTNSILNDNPISVYNNGQLSRDFTYIDDIIAGIIAICLSKTKFIESARVYNIGNNNPVSLINFIETLETALNKKANKIMLPMQAGDVEKTFADISNISQDYGYWPKTDFETGINKFVEWYKKYNNQI